MEQMELRMLTALLDLPGFEVVDATSDQKNKARRLTLVSTEVAAPCPHCHGVTGERHACYDREVVDLPLGGWKTELVAQLFQFWCHRCNKFFSPRSSVLAKKAHATERFLERLSRLATDADVSAAARFMGVAEKTAERWYYDYLKRQTQDAGRDLEPITCLGIDELSLKKDTGSTSAC
jgi:transposase